MTIGLATSAGIQSTTCSLCGNVCRGEFRALKKSVIAAATVYNDVRLDTRKFERVD